MQGVQKKYVHAREMHFCSSPTIIVIGQYFREQYNNRDVNQM